MSGPSRVNGDQEEALSPAREVRSRLARVVGPGVLAMAVTASAVAVIYSKHLGRSLFVELQSVQQQRDDLNVEWGRLLLEQSTLATHSRIDRIARARLSMAPPPSGEVVVLGP